MQHQARARGLLELPQVSGLLAPIRGGAAELELAGLSRGAKLLLAALLARELDRQVLLVTARNAALSAAASDLECFDELLGGSGGSGAFPAYEVEPFQDLAPHPGLTARRLALLDRALRGELRVVVASVHALLLPVPHPERLRALGQIEIAPGLELDPLELGRRLEALGYQRAELAEEPGQYARRGHILDLYPPVEELPLRLEFDGDFVESLRAYTPATQQSLRTLSRARVTPAREVLLDERFRTQWCESARRRWREPELQAALRDKLTRVREGLGFDGLEFLAPVVPQACGSLFDYLQQPLVLLDEPLALQKERDALAEHYGFAYAGALAERRLALPVAELLPGLALLKHPARRGPTLRLMELGVDAEAGVPWVRCQPLPSFEGRVQQFADFLRQAIAAGAGAALFSPTSGMRERLVELLSEYQIAAAREDGGAPVWVAPGSLSAGFSLPEIGLHLVGERELFGRERLAPRRRGARGGAFLSNFRELKVGDFMVHFEHGIGRYTGVFSLGLERGEALRLEYLGGDALLLPMDQLHMVQRYSGVEGSRPKLDRLGGASFARTKKKVQKALADMADELLALYAERRRAKGFAFAPDSHLMREFEAAFEFEETPDQAQAIEEVRADLEAGRPMDRLLCGDVGYGKTEVAMRAAFKCVLDGKQVAFLTPTTILAEQHLLTFRRRFSPFPVRVEMLSRFLSPKQQRRILVELEAGKVDVLIGTHRLLSRDVHFRDLGLVVVDEEQRFGVGHKERLKRLKVSVDVLSLSATPIPRTLHMALSGVRDLSVIETPPRDRLAIHTRVVPFKKELVTAAIGQELERGGQVFFVHNRVESINAIAALLKRLTPNASIGIAHGQLSERELESVMLRFIEGRLDVLVASSIIENGLDVPNANTLIVNRADRFGLSQLYQLRGRVGRSNRRAYAYLIVPSERLLAPLAKKRLAAIRDFSDLGSGFRIAAMDLEIRGAGNLLGREQSGHIAAIGFDLYCKLLEEAVRERRGEEAIEEFNAVVRLDVDARLPQDYVDGESYRIMAYRRLAVARSAEELEQVRAELSDRYGQPPEPVQRLLEVARIRLLAQALRVQRIEHSGATIQLLPGERSKVRPQRVVELMRRRRDLSVDPTGRLLLSSPADPAQRIAAVWALLLELGGADADGAASAPAPRPQVAGERLG